MATPTVDHFRSSVRKFLEAHAPLRVARGDLGQPAAPIRLFRELPPEKVGAELEDSRRWRSAVYDGGFGWITGPEEYGGLGLPSLYQLLYREVESAFDVPSDSPFSISLGMVAPTVLAHGTTWLKDRHLQAMHRGDVIACQLFSEPEAGSDLAAVRTTAVRAGNGWRIEGQKVWTSGAQFADIGLVLARTDSSAPKHKGLTAFVVDMADASVEVRPLRQMTGGSDFNEVFIQGAHVTDDSRVGDVGGGWGVVRTTLMHERATVGTGGSRGDLSSSLPALADVLRGAGSSSSADIARDRYADLYINLTVARLNNSRALEATLAGHPPGPELSVAKLAYTLNLQRISTFVSECLGPSVIAYDGGTLDHGWTQFILGVPGYRLGGGTDEILRNVVAERILGLPR